MISDCCLVLPGWSFLGAIFLNRSFLLGEGGPPMNRIAVKTSSFFVLCTWSVKLCKKIVTKALTWFDTNSAISLSPQQTPVLLLMRQAAWFTRREFGNRMQHKSDNLLAASRSHVQRLVVNLLCTLETFLFLTHSFACPKWILSHRNQRSDRHGSLPG